MNEAFEQERRPSIYRFKRAFLRRATQGMKVQFGRTVNVQCSVVIDHFEIECPGYELTSNGPELISIEDVEIE